MGNRASWVESLPHSLILWCLFIVIKWTLHSIFPLCGYDVLIGSFPGFLQAFCLVPAQDTDWTFLFLSPYSFLLHIVHSFPRGNHCNCISWLSLLIKSSATYHNYLTLEITIVLRHWFSLHFYVLDTIILFPWKQELVQVMHEYNSVGGRISIWRGKFIYATYFPKSRLVLYLFFDPLSGISFLFAMRSRSLCLLKTVAPNRKYV